jgi:nicotinamidase-related amidase
MQVELLDRAPFRTRMLERLRLSPRTTAIVTIDMHRGHLDPAVATMPATPEDCERVIANAAPVLAMAREWSMPIVHVILTYRKIPGLGSEGMINPFWRTLHDIADETDRLTPGRKSTVDDHNIVGSIQTEIIPELFAETDYIIDNKKRLDCFHGTDLEILLRTLGAEAVCLMGINTNTCVLNTAFSAFNRDYRTIVLSDCVASMYGEDLHQLGLQNVYRCLGWVLSNDELRAKLSANA